MPWHLPERDTHEVSTPGGHQEDGEACGHDVGGGPTDGDRAHEGGGEPGHYGLESALKNRYVLWMISLVVTTYLQRSSRLYWGGYRTRETGNKTRAARSPCRLGWRWLRRKRWRCWRWGRILSSASSDIRVRGQCWRGEWGSWRT